MNKNEAAATAKSAAISAATNARSAAVEAKRKYASFKAAFLNGPKLLADAEAEAVELTTRPDVPHVLKNGKPVDEDLNDVKTRWWGLVGGGRLSGRLLVDDLATGGASPAEPLALGLLVVSFLFLYVFGGFGAQQQGQLGLLGGFFGLLSLVAIAAAWKAVGGVRTIIATLLCCLPLARFSLLAGNPGQLAIQILYLLPALLIAFIVISFNGSGGFIAGLRHHARTAFEVVLTIAITLGLAYVLGRIPVLSLFTAPILFLPAVLYPWLYARGELIGFYSACAAQDIRYAGETNSPADVHLVDRQQQAETAAKDTSPKILIGWAKGIFTKRMDAFAPDAGLPIIATLNDFFLGTFIFGAMGTGKTSLLKSIAKQIFANEKVGGLILDSKEQLPADMKGLDNYTVIEPGTPFALIEGLSPQDFVVAMEAVNPSMKKPQGDGNSSFFMNTGHELMLAVAVATRMLCDATPDEWKWTLKSVREVLDRMAAHDESSVNMIHVLENALSSIKSPGQRMVAEDAIDKLRDFSDPEKPDDKTREGVISTVNSWISPIFGDPRLVEWTRLEHGIQLADIRKGARFGVCLPAFRYGLAGRAISALVKVNVYSGIRDRGDHWREHGETPVVIMCDEAQSLITDMDEEFLPQGRSLGAISIYATQTKEGFEKVIGKAASEALLACFQNKVMLKSTKSTYEYIASVLGITRRHVWKTPKAAIGFAESVEMLANSALANPSHPGYNWFRRLRRQGVGRFAFFDKEGVVSHKVPIPGANGKTRTVMDHRNRYLLSDSANIEVITDGEWEVGPLLKPEEADALLQGRGMAVVEVMRGGVRRRDIAKLKVETGSIGAMKPEHLEAVNEA